MDTSGIGGNTSNNAAINDVLDQTNGAANDAADAASAKATSAMGQIFFSLVQKMLSEAQSNSSNGA